jgi:hypothetical protein
MQKKPYHVVSTTEPQRDDLVLIVAIRTPSQDVFSPLFQLSFCFESLEQCPGVIKYSPLSH